MKSRIKLQKKQPISMLLPTKDKFKFNEIGRIMYIYKAINSEGDHIEEECKEGDVFVIGFRIGKKIYRGLIPYFLLKLSPVSPEYGRKYRFVSLTTPQKRETYYLIPLYSINPLSSISGNFY